MLLRNALLPASRRRVLRLLQAPRPLDRALAAKILGAFCVREREAVSALVAALNDEDPRVRRAADRALATIFGVARRGA